MAEKLRKYYLQLNHEGERQEDSLEYVQSQEGDQEGARTKGSVELLLDLVFNNLAYESFHFLLYQAEFLPSQEGLGEEWDNSEQSAGLTGQVHFASSPVKAVTVISS